MAQGSRKKESKRKQKSKTNKKKKKTGGTYKEPKNKSTKKSGRRKVKYPGLDTNYVLPIRRDAVDYDYIDQLTDEEKRWLNSFTEEWTGGYFRHGKKQVHPNKLKKDCYNRNNSRNRCIYSRAQARNNVTDFAGYPSKEDESKYLKIANSYEDALINELDKKWKKKKND